MSGPPIVTGWWRTPRVWLALAHWLPTLNRPVTVWSGAAGSGEEAYTAAAVLWDVDTPGHVLATDLRADLLDHARTARYRAEDVLRDMREAGNHPAAGRYFDLIPGHQGVVRPVAPLRDRVDIGTPLRLGTDPAPTCDVAILRNVWRHLDEPGQVALAEHLDEHLAADGRLVLGGTDLLRPDLATAWVPAGVGARFTPAEHELVWRRR